jgi:hypothetical protein
MRAAIVQGNARLIATAIVAAGVIVAAAILVTGRYSIGKHYAGADAQHVYGIDSWTGEPFVKSRVYDEELWPKVGDGRWAQAATWA